MTRIYPRGGSLGTLAILLAISVTTYGARAGLDGDGYADLVLANDGPNQICLGNSVGTFTCSDLSIENDFSNAAGVADVNGDGGPGIDRCRRVAPKNCEG